MISAIERVFSSHYIFFFFFLLQMGEHRMDFIHDQKLQEVGGKQQLRVVAKLTKGHVSADNLHKMNAKLAVQV